MQTACRLLLTGFLAVLPLCASPMPATQTADTTLQKVSIDVIALTKHGEPVSDLRAEDFRLCINNKQQKIESVTERSQSPVAVGFLFDTSASERINHGRGEEIHEAKNLRNRVGRPDDTGYVVGFDIKPTVYSDASSELSEAEAGLAAVANATPGGEPALYEAICSIQKNGPSPIQERVVLLVFSQFDDPSHRVSERQAIECAQRAGIRIYSIVPAKEFLRSYQQGDPHNRARDLAEETGGREFLPKTRRDLPTIFSAIGEQLRGGYRLSFEAHGNGDPAKPDKIEVSSSRHGAELFYSKALFLP
jgi:VWFA-related protein